MEREGKGWESEGRLSPQTRRIEGDYSESNACASSQRELVPHMFSVLCLALSRIWQPNTQFDKVPLSCLRL